MRPLLALGVLVFVGSVGNAQATTITFDDLPLDMAGSPGVRVSGGFAFNPATHSHIVNGDSNAYNGTQFMALDDVLGADPVTFSEIGGASFALTSIDVAEWSNDGTLWARQIVVTGNVFGGGTVTTTINVDGIFDGNTVGGVADFQTAAFDATWGNLSSVVLKGTGANPGNHFGFDNVVVDATAVPEPGTLTLLGLGSAYLVGRRRRNRR